MGPSALSAVGNFPKLHLEIMRQLQAFIYFFFCRCKIMKMTAVNSITPGTSNFQTHTNTYIHTHIHRTTDRVIETSEVGTSLPHRLVREGGLRLSI